MLSYHFSRYHFRPRPCSSNKNFLKNNLKIFLKHSRVHPRGSLPPRSSSTSSLTIVPKMSTHKFHQGLARALLKYKQHDMSITIATGGANVHATWRSNWHLPQFWTSSLFSYHSGTQALYVLTRKCTKHSCWQQTNLKTQVTYRFPLCFVSLSISITITKRACRRLKYLSVSSELTLWICRSFPLCYVWQYREAAVSV